MVTQIIKPHSLRMVHDVLVRCEDDPSKISILEDFGRRVAWHLSQHYRQGNVDLGIPADRKMHGLCVRYAAGYFRGMRHDDIPDDAHRVACWVIANACKNGGSGLHGFYHPDPDMEFPYVVMAARLGFRKAQEFCKDNDLSYTKGIYAKKMMQRAR